MLKPATQAQMFTLPPNVHFIVAGIHRLPAAKKMLQQLGRPDVTVHSEYWIDDMSWAYDDRRVVLDVAFSDAETTWRSFRFNAAVHVLGLLGRMVP